MGFPRERIRVTLGILACGMLIGAESARAQGGGIRGQEERKRRSEVITRYLEQNLQQDLIRFVDRLNTAAIAETDRGVASLFEYLKSHALKDFVHSKVLPLKIAKEGECIDEFGNPVYASSTRWHHFEEICIDPLRYTDEYRDICNTATARPYLLGSFFHELGHLRDFTEDQSAKIDAYVQDYVRFSNGPRDIRPKAGQPMAEEEVARIETNRKLRIEQHRLWTGMPRSAELILEEAARLNGADSTEVVNFIRGKIRESLPLEMSALLEASCLWPITESLGFLEGISACAKDLKGDSGHLTETYFMEAPIDSASRMVSAVVSTATKSSSCRHRARPLPFNPGIARACLVGALGFLRHDGETISPLDYDGQENEKLLVVNYACGLPSMGVPSKAWDVSVGDQVNGSAKSICLARAASAMADPDSAAHLVRKRPLVQFVERSCSLGVSGRLSGNLVENLRWPTVDQSSCYRIGLQSAQAVDLKKLSRAGLERYQYTVLSGICNFPDAALRKNEVSRASFSCFEQGLKHVPARKNVRLIRGACEPLEARDSFRDLESCMRTGANFLASYYPDRREAAPNDPAAPGLLHVILAAVKVSEEVKTAMISSALKKAGIPQGSPEVRDLLNPPVEW